MTVLVVDDERAIRESIQRILKLEGYEVDIAENGLSAERKIVSGGYDAVISDQKMPGMTGVELLEAMRKRCRRERFIVMSAYGDISDAVEAIRRGAADYIAKPFNPEDLILRLKRMEREIRLREPNGAKDFIGAGPAMGRLKDRMVRIAETEATVLITGESGTGKEVAARFIHDASAASAGPFVAINLGGMPENLLESELFGHEAGAFTGADKRKDGLFEAASGGTLFLDEIGEMPMPVQVKMLRVLQERTFRRLGSNKESEVRARIIAATNRNLEEEVTRHRFREDLFYRLDVARIHLPPLRERREDIPDLAGHFLAVFNRRMGREVTGLDADAAERLASWPFPGNIRELENIIERAMIYAEGDRIRLEDLDLPETAEPGMRLPEPGSLKEMEKRAVRAALERWEGNRTRAAEELGISRRTIINKIAEFGLSKSAGS